MPKPTVRDLLNIKGRRQITLVAVHDYNTAQAAEAAGIDMLVTWTGQDSLEGTVHLVNEIRRAAPNTLIGAGLPYVLPRTSDAEAVRCALTTLRAGADLIYSSGMSLGRFKALAEQRIPCVGHVGLLPVHATWMGGLRAVGKTADEALQVYRDTLAFQQVGAVAVEMECVPHKVAAEISRRVDILVFSMGSGPDCDGQFLFSSDILGTHTGHYPKHARTYCHFYKDSVQAFRQYAEDVRNGSFPGPENVIRVDEQEYAAFMEKIGGC
ncbi:MAG: 3-methyl-2-oxobutanoate hydroxymethyltransferase [Anaerolineae bacterium]